MPGPALNDKLEPFPAGVSANPGGRPKKTPEMREAERLAREKSPRAITRLAEIMESADEKAAVSACNAILDRALGKPVQAITAEVEHKGDVSTGELVRAELRRLLAPLAARTVDAQVVEQPALPAPAKDSEK